MKQGFLHSLISVNWLKSVEVIYNLHTATKCGASRKCFHTQKCNENEMHSQTYR